MPILDKQDFKDAKRDIEDIGKAVNTEAIIKPRWGAAFRSIPLVSKDWLNKMSVFESNANKLIEDLKQAIKDVEESGAEGGGWTDSLIKTWSGLLQSEKNKEVLSLRDFGAKGDGVTDDTQAINNAIKNGGYIHAPKGVYLVSGAIKYPSGLSMFGDGIDETIFKMSPDAQGNIPTITSIFYTGQEHTNFADNISLSDFTIDSNGYNRPTWTGSGYARESGINISATRNMIVERVKSINGFMHCFDINASRIYREEGANIEGVGRSKNITFRDCIAENPMTDDAFTTHFTDGVLIDNCKAYRTMGGGWTTQGFEIDDGTVGAVVSNCISEGFVSGFQAKAHDNAMPARNVTFLNCRAVKCSVGYHVQSLVVAAGINKKGSNIKILSCYNEENIMHYPTEFSYQCSVLVLGLNGVVVRDMYDKNTPNGGGIRVMSNNNNILIDGYIGENVCTQLPVDLTGRGVIHFNASHQGGLCVKNVRLTSPTPCVVVNITNTPNNIIVDNVRATGSDANIPAVRVNYGSGQLGITNIHTIGFLADISVLNGYFAGNYSNGVGNGAFTTALIKELRVGDKVNQSIIQSGSGTPEGKVTLPVGSLYMDANGATGKSLYIKESGSGNTGWVSVSGSTEKNDLSDTFMINKHTHWSDSNFSINVANSILNRQTQLNKRNVVSAYSSSDTGFFGVDDTVLNLPKTSELGSKMYVYWRNKSDYLNRSRLEIGVTPVPTTGSNETINILCIGDSNIWIGGPALIKQIASEHNYNVVTKGTYYGQSFLYKGSTLSARFSEARSGMGITSMTYETTNFKPIDDAGAEAGDTGVITVAAYNALTNTNKAPFSPMLRKATSSDDQTLVRNGYIFDFKNYLTKFSIDIPDVIYFCFGINEISNLPPLEAKSKFIESADIIFSQIRKDYPSIKIVMGHNPPSNTEGKENSYWNDYTVEIFKAKRDLAIKYNIAMLNTHLIDLGETSMGMSNTVENGYGLLTGQWTDGIHYYGAVRIKYYDYVAANIVAAFKNLI